jgi:hypothetical protein
MSQIQSPLIDIISMPAISTNSNKSDKTTPCDPGYNTLTFSIKDNDLNNIIDSDKEKEEKSLKSYTASLYKSMMDQVITPAVPPSSSGTGVNKTFIPGKPAVTTDIVTMCVNKKCPDGNYAVNTGKFKGSSTNIYSCLYYISAQEYLRTYQQERISL